jgi:hypothetical protein
MFKCPRCGETETLFVAAVITVRLHQTDDHIETEPVDSKHEWDDDSRMWCGRCKHQGRVIAFDADPADRPTTPAVIPARVETDDGRMSAAFDALSWFKQASEDEILALAQKRRTMWPGSWKTKTPRSRRSWSTPRRRTWPGKSTSRKSPP